MKENHSEKTKILVLSTELDFGGVETSILSRALALQKYDYVLEFACLRKLGKTGRALQSHGFKVYDLETDPKIQNLKNIFLLRKLLRQVKPDILHTICIEANFHGVIAAMLTGIKKTIAEEVGVPIDVKAGAIRSWHARQAGRLVWKIVDAGLAISHAVKTYLVKYENASDSKIKTIHYFVNSIFLQGDEHKQKKSGEEIIIGCIARLSPEKGQEFLLRAMKIVLSENKNKNLRLRLVGDGPDKQKLQQLSQDLGISDAVEFLGFRDDIPDLLKQMDIFALPSLTEGLCIAILEAAASGVPVVACGVGGVPEIIEHRKNGILVAEGNAESLAQGISEMLNLTDEQREKIIAEARKTVVNNYSEEKIVGKFIDLYKTGV